MMTTRWRIAILGWLLFVGVSSCGDEDGGEVLDTGPRDGYPEGTYGTTQGTTIANLSFTTSEGGTLTLQDIYADGGNRVLLINTAAGWCTACIEDQGELQRLHETYGSQGLYVLEAVFEDESFEPADPTYASTWKTRHDLAFTVVADTENTMGGYYDTASAPMNMIIDVPTMRIERVLMGWDGTVIEALIQSKL